MNQDDSLSSQNDNAGRNAQGNAGNDKPESIVIGLPSFRLNAPQATDDAIDPSEEMDNNSFASIGDALEETQPEPFAKIMPAQKTSSAVRYEKPLESGSSERPQSARQEKDVDSRRAALDEVSSAINDEGGGPGLPLRFLICVGLVVVALLVGLIAVVAIALDKNDRGTRFGPATLPRPSGNLPSPSISPIPQATEIPINMPTSVPATVLGQIALRGFLRCGVPEQPGFSTLNSVTGTYEGFDVDLCRAVAAAIFGDDGHVEFMTLSAFERFAALVDGKVDMLARTTTHTMERQVHEATTGHGFSFSIPYLYNGLQFGGIPPYVHCANNFTTAGECADTRICVLDGTTHIADITAANPGFAIVSSVDVVHMQKGLADGFCNVIAGEQFDIAESLVIEQGYLGDYELGTDIHSKEPLCMVTRDDDPQWSDFVNWVLQALLTAEHERISQRTANLLPTTTLFGDEFSQMFRYAVATVGNYGEIYRRHLEDILPRPIPDGINYGDTGLIYSFPFGDLQRLGDAAIIGGTLESIKQRGKLRCGVSRRAIFAQLDPVSQKWSGFDVDFCRALSAAIFEGDPDKVIFTDLLASVRFQALESGEVDVLSRLTTVTFARDVNEPTVNLGFTFTQPNFYDGLTFGGTPPYAQCADRLDVTSLSCKDLLICVNQNTTFEARLKELFPQRFIVPQQSGELAIEGLVTGACNTIAGGVIDVSLTSVRSAGYSGLYQTGATRFSKDPLALVTRQDDPQWSKFVFWIVSLLFYADEQGISQLSANDTIPEVNLFGPDFVQMFRHAVNAVGSYGEIYERNAELDVPRSGLNQLNLFLRGPQHYPYPGLI